MSLINQLIDQGYLKTEAIINAFSKVRRVDFVRPEDKEYVEVNAPLSIGYGQTISQPLTVAFMIELLEPKPGEKILDVGSGSGWTVALLAEIVGLKGKVYGIEKIRHLKDFAVKNIDQYNYINQGIVQIFCSDGYQGLPDFAPFDKIIVAAAAEAVPEKLLVQLKIGGKIVIPIGKQYESQDIVAIDKISQNEFKEKRYPGFIFVPLVKN